MFAKFAFHIFIFVQLPKKRFDKTMCVPGRPSDGHRDGQNPFWTFSKRFLESLNAYKTGFLISNRLSSFQDFFVCFLYDFYIFKYLNEFLFRKDFLSVFQFKTIFPFSISKQFFCFLHLLNILWPMSVTVYWS